MAKIDAERVIRLFSNLGEKLRQPTTLCLIGSTPAIASGQPGRQTADIDVWHEKSDYDAGDLARACREVGLLYDPTGELDPDSIYVQLVRPGVVRLPADFEVESIGRYGKLSIVMPPPEIIVAAKLVRGSEADIHDAIWWVHRRNLALSKLEARIHDFPDLRDREAALENLTFVRLARR